MKALRWLLLLVLPMALITTAALAWDESAIPTIPHAFYGSVTVNGTPAVIGAVVEATGTGVRTGLEGNPIVTTETGVYARPHFLEPHLIVQGDIPDGTVLTFSVDGVQAAQTATWVEGESTELNLSVVTLLPNGDGTLSYIGPERTAGKALAGLSFKTAYVLTPQLWSLVTADTVLPTGAILVLLR